MIDQATMTISDTHRKVLKDKGLTMRQIIGIIQSEKGKVQRAATPATPHDWTNQCPYEHKQLALSLIDHSTITISEASRKILRKAGMSSRQISDIQSWERKKSAREPWLNQITKDQKTAVASAFIPDSGTLDSEKIDEVKVKFGITMTQVYQQLQTLRKHSTTSQSLPPEGTSSGVTNMCKLTVDMDQQDINLCAKSKKCKILNNSEITTGWSAEDLNKINRIAKTKWKGHPYWVSWTPTVKKLVTDGELDPIQAKCYVLNCNNQLKVQWPTTVPGLKDYLGEHLMLKYNGDVYFLLWQAAVEAEQWLLY